jgi:hypothetical protein
LGVLYCTHVSCESQSSTVAIPRGECVKMDIDQLYCTSNRCLDPRAERSTEVFQTSSEVQSEERSAVSLKFFMEI